MPTQADSAALQRLARGHMQRQVREVAQTQTALARLWDRTMDPADIDGSFQKFQALATPLIKTARDRGELTAQTYFEQSKAEAGYTTPPATVDFQPTATLENRNALHATSVAFAKRQIKRGVPAGQALSAAKIAMLGSAKRRVLEAPRRRIIALSKKDKDVKAWARVSDGHPCPFCLMLVSRGPVYSFGTGDFQAHDRCGCSAMPVYRNDRSNGWTPAAKDARKLYDDWGGDYNDVRWALAHPDEAEAALAKRKAA